MEDYGKMRSSQHIIAAKGAILKYGNNNPTPSNNTKTEKTINWSLNGNYDITVAKINLRTSMPKQINRAVVSLIGRIGQFHKSSKHFEIYTSSKLGLHKTSQHGLP